MSRFEKKPRSKVFIAAWFGGAAIVAALASFPIAKGLGIFTFLLALLISPAAAAAVAPLFYSSRAVSDGKLNLGQTMAAGVAVPVISLFGFSIAVALTWTGSEPRLIDKVEIVLFYFSYGLLYVGWLLIAVGLTAAFLLRHFVNAHSKHVI